MRGVVQSFAILPAAGRSLRMGQPKLLLPWQGATIAEAVLAAWRASRVSRIVVVLHPDDVELAQRCRGPRTEVVVAERAPPDMKSSVRLGLDVVTRNFTPQSGDVWLLAPADMPLLTAAAIDRVLAAHDPARPEIIVPCHARRRGHPVLFPWPLAQEVFALGDEEGINQVVRRHRALELPLDDASILADLDTPADYEHWRSPDASSADARKDRGGQ